MGKNIKIDKEFLMDIELTEKFEIDSCKNPVKYSLIHKNIPIKMDREMREAIAYLLWYVPDINSIQSKKNELISNMEYDTYTFIEIMKYMDLEDKDVLFTDKIDYDLVKKYQTSICLKSQKLILTQGEYETKSQALLRHIRNSIAHGSFNVVEDLVIGFDEKNVDKYKTVTTAIFKIKPKNLLRALRRINEDISSRRLISIALEKCSYHVEDYQEEYQRSNKFDLYAKKEERRYAIEIRNYDSKKDIDRDFAIELVEDFKDVLDGVKPLLVINTSFLTEESKNELIGHNVIILDVKNIKKMLKGRDMIIEIEKAHSDLIRKMRK